MSALMSSIPTRFSRLFKWGLLASMIGGVTLVIGQASPPLVELAAEPLYMNGAKAKANLTLALSVEFPTVGQTYRDTFDSTKEYVGYFDPKACYRAILSNGSLGNYFDWQTNKGSPAATCPSSQFDGNFMNWATSSAIDIMRYGLTGGNRTIDDTNTTVVDRAWLPDNFYRNSTYFSEKFIPKAQIAGRTELSDVDFPNGMYIYNCRNRVYFANASDGSGNCASPFGVANAQSDKLIKANSNNRGNFYEVRNLVCDSNSATNRLMTYDPQSREWQGLCLRYPSGKYKPVGQFQVNSESLRVSVFSYLQADGKAQYGGVMRAPLKYLGPKAYDTNFNLIAGVNPRSEWNVTTGVFVENPQAGDATYGDQGYPLSGATNYINRFGTLDPANIGKYKSNDPVSELYYEALRYLQGKQPTAQALVGLNGTVANDKTLAENYPVYRTWSDPFSGFQDTAGTAKSCLRNSILTIADVFTHADQSVPGNNTTSHSDFVRAAETSPTLNVPFWTSLVGGFESHNALAYTDSQGRAQTTSNLNSNTLTFPWLSGASTHMTGAGANTTTLATLGNSGGTYHLAGMAYWANTQVFNGNYPKARVKTFTIDVNENRASDYTNFRQSRQLYLAAKYGGFDDSSTGTGQTGNPYQPGSNVLWIGNDGDAKNFFLVSDAKKFLDSLSAVFARVVEQTGSIAGGAVSAAQIKSGETAHVFQAQFNPVANFWSGRLNKFPVTLVSGSLVLGATATWEAGAVMTTAAKADFGDSRKIVIGAPIGQQGIIAPTPFKWPQIATAHQAALNSMPNATTDTLGEKRLNYLRGDQRDELSSANPTGIFRPRDIVLGDIVNSGLVYSGKPNGQASGSAYRAFYDANKTRKPVIFANANDGMLHAFYDQNGTEAFAYIPGFLASKLNRLPDLDYAHAAFADSTPAVADAFFRGAWRTALVSGVGGGAQGVYALDVTNPETFSKDNVLWEFTERDHPAMGNVIGSPQILKFRVEASTATTPTFKSYAVVASGVNNYAADGYAHAGGNPSLFFLDLNFVPTAAQGWVEGTNFWRIELPQTSVAIAKGLVTLNQTVNFLTGAVDAIYTGDLQGNLWKLDFSKVGVTSLGLDAAANFRDFNPLTADSALFVAKASDGTSLQPITSRPEIVQSYFGKKLVAFGTGKFLEATDASVPLTPTATFYSVLDDAIVLGGVAGRASLQQGTVSGTGTITVPTFTLGAPPTVTPNVKSGYYFDFNASIGERQIGGLTRAGDSLVFGSIFPTFGSCGEGGGREYRLNARDGNGISKVSNVGILSPPLVIELGESVSGDGLGKSDTTGQRTATKSYGSLNLGNKGAEASDLKTKEDTQTGRISWRQINNYRSIAKP